MMKNRIWSNKPIGEHGAAWGVSDLPQRAPLLSIVIPVYRSAECLEALILAIDDGLLPESYCYETILVNDGSPDESWSVIERICASNPRVIGMDLRRNFGQDNAILTGIRAARGKYIAIMDDDLQHDPRELPRLIGALEPEIDLVYADFRKKQHKSWKRLGSWFNGKVAEWVLHKPRDVYLSPYKVFRREVAELICEYHGGEPYVDGLLLQVTSRVTHIPVDHRPRYAGRSTYTLYKSIRVWARVTFSFSIKPLRIVTVFGFAFSVMGGALAVAIILFRLLSPESFGINTMGWASLAVAVLFFGGIQMVFFGILGEYAGRTYLRVNGQPQTSIRSIIGCTNSSESLRSGSREDSVSTRGRAATRTATDPAGWPAK